MGQPLIGNEQEPADCKWSAGHFGGSFLQEFPDRFLKNQSRPSKEDIVLQLGIILPTIPH